MRKEVIIAIILGISLGLVLAFGVYQANRATNTTPKTAQVTPTPTPGNSNTNQALINIVNPQDGEIFNSPVATVSGSTQSNNMITILSENDELFVKPQPDGTFQAEVNLDSGVNNLQISVVTPQGQKQDINLKVVYTTAVKVE